MKRNKLKVLIDRSGDAAIVNVWLNGVKLDSVLDYHVEVPGPDSIGELRLVLIGDATFEYIEKWKVGEYRTKGGFRAKIGLIDTDEGRLFGAVKDPDDGTWWSVSWDLSGAYISGETCAMDLVR